MKITIRPLEEKDAYTSWRWRNDPEVFANTVRRYSGPVTLQNELDWIRTVLDRPDERRFAILADGIYIGNVYLTEIKNKEGKIGTFIGEKSYWNRGIGTIAKRLLIEFAFKTQKIKTVISIVRKENIASRKVNDKLGFKEFLQHDDLIYYKITPAMINLQSNQINI